MSMPQNGEKENGVRFLRREEAGLIATAHRRFMGKVAALR
jgi:hypothetical protein